MPILSLTNKAAVKKYALQMANKHRKAQGVTRVSAKFLNSAEENMRPFILDSVQRHPSKGKTLSA